MESTASIRTLTVGEPAPNSHLTSVDGTPIELASFWARAPKGTLVVFLRNFGCIFCREQAKLLRDAYQEFIERDAAIVAIGLGTPGDAAEFATWLKLPYPVLGHPDPSVHAEWGLGLASAVNMLNPDLMKRGFRALTSGSMQGKPTGEPKQLPGVFFVDRGGIIRVARPGAHPGDNPPIKTVLAAVDAALQRSVD